MRWNPLDHAEEYRARAQLARDRGQAPGRRKKQSRRPDAPRGTPERLADEISALLDFAAADAAETLKAELYPDQFDGFEP